MNDLAVRIEGLSKQYRIQRVQQPTLLREAATDLARRTARALTNPFRRREDGVPATIWALRDVSFDVQRGESLAIIGSNGSGKSTLLKLLSRITQPTEGNAWIKGRVGSLLEVGTGFHPELSGRENTYLSGAILGMKRREIDRKFDEIVAFSGVERFIDTPVKRYSSGMYLRLAFAVAAHLEPEILVVDEVLAVGDASFQRKCIAKMAAVAREGRTVLFVSHNMAAVQTLCSKAAHLSEGRLVSYGVVDRVVSDYLRSLDEVVAQSLHSREDRRGTGEFRFTAIEISGAEIGAAGVLAAGQAGRFTFHLSGFRPGLSVGFTIFNAHGQPVCSFDSRFSGTEDGPDGAPGTSLICEVPDLPLVPGSYRINASVSTDHEMHDYVEGAALFEVIEGAVRGRHVGRGSVFGNVLLQHRWVLPAGATHG